MPCDWKSWETTTALYFVFDTIFLFHSIARFKSHVPSLQYAKFDFFHEIHSY